MKRKNPLSKQKILRVALQLADKKGVSELSMRKLAQKLNVEAMSLYNYFKNKDEILDGLVDRIFGEIKWPLQNKEVDWRSSLTDRAFAFRKVLLKHPWAIGLLNSRTNAGPNTLAHHNQVIGCLLRSGFSIELCAHTYAVMDSFIYGFALQENTLPAISGEKLQDVAALMMAQFSSGDYPHLLELTQKHFLKPDYSFADEFSFGFELVCDGIERLKNK